MSGSLGVREQNEKSQMGAYQLSFGHPGSGGKGTQRERHERRLQKSCGTGETVKNAELGREDTRRLKVQSRRVNGSDFFRYNAAPSSGMIPSLGIWY